MTDRGQVSVQGGEGIDAGWCVRGGGEVSFLDRQLYKQCIQYNRPRNEM